MAKIPPLFGNSPIVDRRGIPTPDFLLLINQLLSGEVNTIGAQVQEAIDAAHEATEAVATLSERRVDGTTDEITGGGALGDGDIVLGLADTAVEPGTYGDDTHVPRLTVDQKGRLVEVVEVPITGGGGGGGGAYAPMVSGELPGPVLMATSDGQCIMVEIAA